MVDNDRRQRAKLYWRHYAMCRQDSDNLFSEKLVRQLLPVPTAVTRYRVFTAVCLSLYLHNVSKTDAARITKHDTQMFHDESWKPIHFGINRSKISVTRCKNVPAWAFALLWVLASSAFTWSGAVALFVLQMHYNFLSLFVIKTCFCYKRLMTPGYLRVW